ncbi:MAG: 16S rRNA (cytosine(967)-C(5))-methyltransferase RsmB [Ruminococcus sp.]|nr:16S rRNA (cytosine(967)-C(5))-methyltransferase RsmB [Ruminococcus sp.]
MADARRFTVRLLTRIDEKGAYSNLLLDESLSRSELSEQDKRFASALFYGTLERRYTLDEVIRTHLKNPGAKLSCEVRNILRTGIYQILYMDSVPESAAVDESVKLAKKCRNPAAAGFVNGLLRSFIREGKKLPEADSKVRALSLEYSCPEWLTEKWCLEYGEDTARVMLETSLGQAPVTVRANTLKRPVGEIISILQEDGFGVEKTAYAADCLRICGAGVEHSRAYKEGLIHVQDLSCQLCCEALGAEDGETVLDICSAPGGKAFTIAERMHNCGRVLAFDLHGNRVKLIKSGADRLGLTIIEASVNDGKKFSGDIPEADRVLCDVPCSGLGVIRRKPEIKYKDPGEFERLPEIQYAILETSSRYVKKGGTLVYSTCTLSQAENGDVVRRFLDGHKGFTAGTLPEKLGGGGDVTITPDKFGSDGFYIAVFVRKE